MRIKKIEAAGFKSFADKQVVIVDDRITGVIGPNGCGKSNIVDAMRWCLGEQRAKHLRGSGMADVIFSGCATRGAANAAEVTVTFDNDGNVPSAYLNFSEISVSRRLFRDGTSEYLLNKVPCRLRDISEMLMGTGIGTRGYSIIEQGRVSDIVVSKPEDRRAILDEAAGITKFKVQKTAAERRIEQTQQNLLRVNDVLKELESRIGTLRRQAQKAERYKRYRTEQRELDLWIASHEYLSNTARTRSLSVRRRKLGDELETVRAKMAAIEAGLENEKLAVDAAEKELSTRQRELFEAENKLQLAQQDQRFRTQELERIAQTLVQAQSDRAAAEQTREGLAAEVARSTTYLEELIHNHVQVPDQVAVETLEAATQTIGGQLRQAQAALAEARKRQGDAATRLAALEARLMGRAEALAEVRDRLAEQERQEMLLRAEPDLDEGFLAELEQAEASAREVVANLRARKAELDRLREAAKGERKAAEQALEAARRQLMQVSSRKRSLEEIQQRFRGCASGVQVLIAKRSEWAAHAESAQEGDGLRGLLVDFVRAPERFESALSAILENRLQGLVVESSDQALRGVEVLKRAREGRSAFLPASQRPNHEPLIAAQALDFPGSCGRLIDLVEVESEVRSIFEHLAGDVVVMESLSQALEAWQSSGGAATFVALDGDRVERSGVVYGGASENVDSALLQQRREIRELGEQELALRRTVDEAQAELEAVVARAQGVEEERERSDASIVQSERALSDAASARKSAEQNRARIAAQLVAADRAKAELQATVRQREEERSELELDLADARESMPELGEGIADKAEAVEFLESERTRIAEELTAAKVELARYQQRKLSLENELARAQKQLEIEEERSKRLAQQIEEASARATELQQSIEGLSGEHGELRENHDRLKEARESAQERYDAAKNLLDERSIEIRGLRKDYDSLKERHSSADLALRELELERHALISSVQERFDEPLIEVLVDFHDRPQITPVQREEAAELKRLIARMGEVNLTAIDEYEEVSGRFEFLSAQRSDLESAIKQLQDAIDQINETTRERFKETFEQVNQKFQEIFPRLFNGGRAELVLTDPNNLLDTGVEIMAQPPGKKVSSLELMSGGEKALTAVSLIFGIFLIKPSPFCMLDEVDAPLDEANVGRFCDMVRELSRETQFIIITHNKRTMEAADRLYGVTMQQRGVSKLVSVNMRKALTDLGQASSN
jgi:chromosome segregation protein